MLLSHLKKLGLLCLLFAVRSGLQAQCSSTISTFPYLEDFEITQAWTTSGPPSTPSNAVIDDWAWGTPVKTVINSAGSGTKCWVVGGLTGSSYANGERSYVLSPCFDFTTLVHPYIQFLIFWESEHKYDGSNLQYSLNSGSTWSDVGSAADPANCMNANWYNYNSINGLAAYTTGGTTYQALDPMKNGWCGNIQPNTGSCQGGSGSGGWVTAKHCMPYLAGQSSVRFRFTFGAGTTCNDFNGIAFDSVAIGEAPSNSADFTHVCTSANTVSFTGMVPLCPDTFQWDFGDPGSGGSNTVIGAGTLTPLHTFSGPGSYSVTFTVKGGPCNAPGSITKVINIISATTSTIPLSCSGTNDASAIAIVSGGTPPYSYTWSTTPIQTTDTATGLSAGNYTVTVNAANACSVTTSASIAPSTPLSHTVTTTPAQCGVSNGSAKVIETGGAPSYTYAWSTLATTDSIQNVAGGSYTLTVTDMRGCKDTVPVTISNSGGVNATLAGTVNVSCNGGSNGSITINAANGTTPYTYHWGATTTTIGTQNGFAAGSYTITVTDNAGCISTVSAMIDQPLPITITFPTIVNDSCSYGSDGSITTLVTGGTPGYTYHWSNGDSTPSITGLLPVSYTVTVTDNNLCTVSDSKVITAPPPIAITPSIISISCHGDSDGVVSISVSGGTQGYSYLWSDDSATATISHLHAGAYAVTVTDNNRCTASQASIMITNPTMLAVTASATPQSCSSQQGGAISLSVSGGSPAYTFQWAPTGSPAASITGLNAGSYKYTVTDSHGCTYSDSALVLLASAITLDTALAEPSCPPLADGSITVVPTGGTPGYNYHWSNGSTNAMNIQLLPGTYLLTVTDSKGCTALDTFTLVYRTGLTVSAGVDDTINLGESVTLTGISNTTIGNIYYNWSPDYQLSCTSCQSTVASPLQTFTYILIASTGTGCTATDSITVFVNKTYDLFVPNAFTPNGDGINDNFEIFGNKSTWKYIDMEIFNRWGEKVFESTDEGFKWDGTYRSTMQMPGVYVYFLNINFIDGHSIGTQTGSITLIR